MILLTELQVFFAFILVGIIISLIFDIFRIIRKTYNFSNYYVYMQDIMFWIIAGIIILESIFIFNSGNIRFYLFFSIFIGAMIYAFTISHYVIKFGSILLKSINKIIMYLTYPINIIFKFIKKILLKNMQSLKKKKRIKNNNDTNKQLTVNKKIGKNIKK